MKAKKRHKLYEWQQKAKQRGFCHTCKSICESLSVDHIIPATVVDMLDETGLLNYEWEENFELLCSACNKFKANRIDKKHPKTKELLLQLID